MNLLNAVINWLKCQRDSTSPEFKWQEGLSAYQEGRKHFGDRTKQREALSCFDKAMECGCDSPDMYDLRGHCLQALGYHLDAIEDFDEAISREPEHAELYYMRALSKGRTGDFDGAVSDLQRAVLLSKTDSPYNDYWNGYARETGRPSATLQYEECLTRAKEDRKILGADLERWREDNKEQSSKWRRKPPRT